MNSLTYELTLLSDAAPGSGEVTEMHVDTEVPVDEFGLPMLPAKRIKGLFLESFLEFVESLPDEQAASLDGYRERMFGVVGKADSRPLRFSDALLPDREWLRRWLVWLSGEEYLKGYFTPDRVKNVFTRVRRQTALEQGVVKHQSLRSLRVLNRGLVFTGTIDVPPGAEESIWLLPLLAKNITHLGLGRNRGLGWVEVQVLDAQGHEPEYLTRLESLAG